MALELIQKEALCQTESCAILNLFRKKFGEVKCLEPANLGYCEMHSLLYVLDKRFQFIAITDSYPNSFSGLFEYETQIAQVILHQ